MPTSTNVTNLKINELTEAQYDTAVQGGVIGANEISILTDAEAGQVIQVATLPTASADELGNIYQFVGTTDANYTNGYFYKCVSDGQQPATYSWSNIQVQASSGGLPSQTGQSGKFLTTDGTDASWSDKPLVNKATGTNSLTIGGSAANYANCVNIGASASVYNAQSTVAIGVNCTAMYANNALVVGKDAKCNSNHGVTLGAQAKTDGAPGVNRSNDGIAIGYYATAGSSSNNYPRCVAIGQYANAQAVGAMQVNLGSSAVTNSDDNTVKIANANGNFEIMSADGTIPHARLTNAVQSASVTIATTDWSSNTASVTVSGLTATSVVWVAPDNASQSAYTTAGVHASSQSADTLVFSCTQTPASSLTINVVWC